MGANREASYRITLFFFLVFSGKSQDRGVIWDKLLYTVR